MNNKEKWVQCSLREAQMIMLDILQEVSRICDENNIEYFLAEGTLLGAIRHKGFIPWDDDLDIGMTRENYNKFLKVAPKSIKEGFFVQTVDSDKEYKLYHIPLKVRKNGTLLEEFGEENEKYHRGIYIDIFPFDKIPQSRFKYFIQKKFLGSLVKGKFKNLGDNSSLKWKLRNIIYYILKPLSYGSLDGMIHKTLKWNENSKANCYNYGPELLWDKEFKEQDFFPLRKIIFEGKEFWAPNNADAVLTKVYGDYMTLPPKEDRLWHAKGIYIDVSKMEDEKNEF